MKKRAMKFVLFLAIPSFIVAAPHSEGRRKESTSISKEVRAETQAKITEKERDYLMFTNFVGIVVNFVKLFMDPNNIPEAKQNAYNILNGINNLAHVITRSKLSKEKQEELIMKIIEICRSYSVK